MDNQELLLVVEKEEAGIRIDRYIADKTTDISRSYIQKLIKDSEIKVNNQTIKSNYKVILGDCVSVNLPLPIELNIEPENIPLDILYEDEDILIINKEKGMVVHPAAGHYTGTIVNAVLYHCKGQLSGINGVMRPGIVHRIDMNTTGVIVVCKNDYAHSFLAEQLKEHSITRKYEAIVYHGFKEDTGTIEAPLGRHPIDRKKMAIVPNGKPAITHYKVLDPLNGKYTHVECTLETGRTHQIRVHMASIRHPLLGDEVYGPEKCPFTLQGQTLHAKVLGFIHPTSKEYVEFEAPLPDYFQNLLKKLGK
jgi:pseudouridine synthase, RluA family